MLETITPSASPSCCWAPSSPTNYPRCRRWIPIYFSSNLCSTHKTFFAVLWVLFLSTVFYWQFDAASGGFSIFIRAFPSREFPILRRVAFNLTDFGAVGDGVTLNTVAFEKAVTAISKRRGKGGGQLNVPPGIWLTAPFNLTSHMTLFLAEGAVILGIDEMAHLRVTARKSVTPVTHREMILLDYHRPRTRVQAAICLKELALENRSRIIGRLSASNLERRQQVDELTTLLTAAEKMVNEVFHMFELARGDNFDLRDTVEIAVGQAKWAKEEVDRRNLELSEARRARLEY